MFAADELLRGEGRFAVQGARAPWREIGLLVGACGLLHGAAIGSFGVRAEQMLWSGLKLPLLIAVSTAVCLPNFYAVNTVLGLRDDLAASLRGVLATQATVATALLAFTPIVLFFYVSGASYHLAVLVNGLAFLAAALAGQVTLGRHYAPLVAKNPRHHLARIAWLVLYVFVTIQLAWVLRPFVGSPGMEPGFLRPHAWSNAYVALTKAFLSGWWRAGASY